MSFGMKDDAWPDGDIQRLTELWYEGHSTAEIGRRMNRSYNSVVGKAKRLNLPGRPSPIRTAAEGDPVPPPVARMPRPTVERVAKAPPQAIPKASSLDRQCTWLEGVQKPWTRCENEVPALGKSYCTDHHRHVWVKAERPQGARIEAAD
jgi:GcrA cell cycle regulator